MNARVELSELCEEDENFEEAKHELDSSRYSAVNSSDARRVSSRKTLGFSTPSVQSDLFNKSNKSVRGRKNINDEEIRVNRPLKSIDRSKSPLRLFNQKKEITIGSNNGVKTVYIH
jgi:hypothetical protein